MNTIVEPAPKAKSTRARNNTGTAFGCPRDFLGNRFVYTVISARARGLSVGVNLNPDKQCNFDCPYCEVDQFAPGSDAELDLDVMSAELEATLALVHAGKMRDDPQYALVPPDLLRLRHVAISGDGEPTLCPQFREVVETVVYVRAHRFQQHGIPLANGILHILCGRNGVQRYEQACGSSLKRLLCSAPLRSERPGRFVKVCVTVSARTRSSTSAASRNRSAPAESALPPPSDLAAVERNE